MNKLFSVLLAIVLILGLISALPAPAFSEDVVIVKNASGTKAVAVNKTDKPIHMFICVWETTRNNRRYMAPCDRAYDMKSEDIVSNSGNVEERITPAGWNKLAHQAYFYLPAGGKTIIPGCGGASAWGCRWDKNTMSISQDTWRRVREILIQHNPNWPN